MGGQILPSLPGEPEGCIATWGLRQAGQQHGHMSESWVGAEAGARLGWNHMRQRISVFEERSRA